MRSYFAKTKTFLPVVSRFAAGQIGLQFFNMLNGFFLLRWLSIEQQALFSIAFSVQTLLTSLSDLGLCGSIIALVGQNHYDKVMVGKYIASARYLRNIFFLIAFLLCLVLYPILIKQQAWDSYIFWFNMLPVILAAYFQADMGIYSAPLMIHKKLNALYLPQILSSALRLLVNYILFIATYINSFTTITINALMLLFNSRVFKKKAKDLYAEISKDSLLPQQARGEMLKYVSPQIPGLLFNSIYGQLQVYITAFFGKANNIAEVAALGRLSQLFLLLSAFNSVLIGPFIAKSSPQGLPKKYLASLMLAISIAVTLILSAYILPGFYLFILGEKYYHLESELILIISTASISFVSMVFWIMHNSRQWVFWWASWAYIAGVVLSQIAGLLTINLSTTHGVLVLSLITAVVVFLIQIFIGWYGFRKEHLSFFRIIFNWKLVKKL
jgi:O-antigen/teichoic acid export membrane protein